MLIAWIYHSEIKYSKSSALLFLEALQIIINIYSLFKKVGRLSQASGLFSWLEHVAQGVNFGRPSNFSLLFGKRYCNQGGLFSKQILTFQVLWDDKSANKIYTYTIIKWSFTCSSFFLELSTLLKQANTQLTFISMRHAG